VINSKYFTEDEMRCKCCGGLPENGMDQTLVDLLDAIREQVGKPITLSCAYRCPSHNADVGGVPDSQHVLGCASDLLIPEGYTVETLAEVAEECNADGVGRYFGDEFVHVDTRSGRIGETFRW